MVKYFVETTKGGTNVVIIFMEGKGGPHFHLFEIKFSFNSRQHSKCWANQKDLILDKFRRFSFNFHTFPIFPYHKVLEGCGLWNYWNIGNWVIE